MNQEQEELIERYGVPPRYNSLEEYEMATKTQEQMIREIHETTIELKTVLLGVPETQNGGLVQDVRDLATSHYKLKKHFWILVGLLIGSGILGSSIYTLVAG